MLETAATVLLGAAVLGLYVAAVLTYRLRSGWPILALWDAWQAHRRHASRRRRPRDS